MPSEKERGRKNEEPGLSGKLARSLTLALRATRPRLALAPLSPLWTLRLEEAKTFSPGKLWCWLWRPRDSGTSTQACPLPLPVVFSQHKPQQFFQLPPSSARDQGRLSHLGGVTSMTHSRLMQFFCHLSRHCEPATTTTTTTTTGKLVNWRTCSARAAHRRARDLPASGRRIVRHNPPRGQLASSLTLKSG